MANLPADLPTNWTQGQIISPNGTEVGLSEQYGYNYLNEQVNNTQTEVNSLSADQTSTQQQVNSLNTQVGNIQGQVTTQGQSITALQETTTSQGQSITSLQSQVSSNDTDIAGLQQTTTTQGQNITTLQGQVSTLNQTTTTQGQSISTLQSDVSAINTALDSVAQESSVQDIIDSIGATTDSGATATTGTLMGKVNKLIANPQVVKSRQEIVVGSQEVTLNDTEFQYDSGSAVKAYYADFTIQSVNIDKSIIIANTAFVTYDGNTHLPCARFINSNTIRIYETYFRYSSSSKQSHNIYSMYVQIVEFY